MDAELRQRCGHLEPDEATADDHRRERLAGAPAQLERVVERPQDERVAERPRARTGRDHDGLGVDLVERGDVLPGTQVDVVLGVPVQWVDECVRGLRLTPEQPLRERRPVIRAVRVLRPDRDPVAAPRLPVALDELCGGQPASDDRDHLASWLHIGLHRCMCVRLSFVPYPQVDLVTIGPRQDDTSDGGRRQR